jgi:hypothetical protein
MSTLPRILALMGSGETAPTMVKVHRDLIGRLGKSANAALLDTPYGFQENAVELAQKAVAFFKESIVTDLSVAGVPRIIGGDPVQVERGFNVLRTCTYLFAGPGSPTYALKQWSGSPLAGILADKLANGGVVTFASAAALTLGRVTVPVYEIYKAGEEPHWLDGLDVLAAIGLPVAVIPHYDNAEGGHHDTRFCYLGERRLAMLEAQLPAGHHVLGIDEHTAVIMDLDADTASVVGRGVVTVRANGTSTMYPAGTTMPIDVLRNPTAAATSSSSIAKTAAPAEAEVAPEESLSLRSSAEALDTAFQSALSAGDADGAVRAVLELEATIKQWSADTLTGAEGDEARRILRSMISRLGEVAQGGLGNPRDAVAPFVDTLLELRGEVRKDKRYDLSDLIRDRLAAAKIEVRDTPSGPEWHLG